MMFVRFDDPLSYCNWQYLHRCFLPFHQSQELVRWCSWLSRQSNNVSSLKVSSSSLGRIKCLIFFFRNVRLLFNDQSLLKSYSISFCPISITGAPTQDSFSSPHQSRACQIEVFQVEHEAELLSAATVHMYKDIPAS